jgi:peptidoglycan/LPS O-acetylase OafA/YrhL
VRLPLPFHDTARLSTSDIKTARVFGLDLTRAIAVSLVLMTHASFLLAPLEPNWHALFMFGYLGVEMFFALSGFLIGGLLIDCAAPGARWIRRFWVRRWLRTLPNYYLFLLINLLIYRWIEGRSPPNLMPYIFFVQNLAWPHPLFFQEAWSLALEEVFYFLAPLVMLPFLPFLRRRWQTLLLLIVVLVLALVVRTLYVIDADPTWDEGVRKVSLIRLDAIGYGALAVYLCKVYALGLKLRRWLALFGALGLAAACVVYLTLAIDTSIFARTGLFSLVSVSFAALLPLAAVWEAPPWPQGLIIAVRQLALWSYALYLTNLPIMRVLGKLEIKPTDAFGCYALALSYTAIAVLSAALVYRGFERPILALRDRWFPSRPQYPKPVAKRRQVRA